MPRPNDSSRVPATRPRRLAGLACLAGLTVLVLAGPDVRPAAAAGWRDWPLFRSQSPEDGENEQEAREAKPGTTLDTPYVGHYVTSFGGTSLIAVEGVGLVVGLDNTGEDPPPSHYRSRLVDEIRKRRIDKPNELLARPDTAMVLIRAYLPVNIRKGDTFDAEVFLPPNSAATSLEGGHLLEARLADNEVVQGGRILEGHVTATVSGPILVTAPGDDPSAGSRRKGRILGGAKSKIDRDLAITLTSEFRSTRMTDRVAKAIGRRFHGHDRHGIKVPMAVAKDDQLIELKVPDQYRENYPRYLAVINNIALRETETALQVRLQKLEQQLNVPAESEVAALRLEAIGPPALPILKRALKHEDLEVRFNAAMALTYMGETEGLATLAEAARQEPAFRVYALAALACCKEAEAAVELHGLLSDEVAETRYGAFRALTVLNDRDPVVAGVPMTGGAKEPTYMLHVLKTDGPPLVHLTHHTKAEVVLFGQHQRLQLPAALRCGPHIQVVATPGSSEVVVARYTNPHAGRKVVSPNLAEVLLACDELGATYPDVAAFLMQAERQHNLAGALEIDALPEAGRVYLAKNATGKGRAIGTKYTAPNILAPPNSEAAAARQGDIQEVSAEKAEEGKDDAKADSGVLPAGGTQEEGGVRTADAEVPADEDAAAPEQPGDGPAGERKWYDPRRIFKKPSFLDGGPPPQSEPELE
ncbi:MAG TPA: flagellar basal body P-ring protein FlgI [Planctomycetaceae bacterium]